MSSHTIDSILLTEEQICSRVAELGSQISEDYKGKDLLVVGILKGSFIFLADLVRSIKIPLSVDFVTLASYGDATESSGVVTIVSDLREDVANRHVLIVEDIVDTGWTLSLSGITEHLMGKNAISVCVCTLLDKPSRRRVDIDVSYIGFQIPDKFVVGYGLDFKGLYRNLPYLGCLTGCK